MRAVSVVKWSVLAVVLALLAGAAWLYWQASRVPGEYRYQSLTPTQRRQAAKDFVSRLADFNRYAQNNEPFSWSIDQDRINRYMASLEEIAAVRPGHKAGTVTEALREAGLADPAVSLEEGKVLLMVRSIEHDKIVSVSLDLEFTSDRRLRVKLEKASVGELTLPRDWVTDRLNTVQKSLGTGDGPKDPNQPTNPTAKVAYALTKLLSGINAEPIEPVGTWDGRKIRIQDITIADGRLTLQVKRVQR
ncbi:MAG: hypothetical protein ACLFV7_04405 [Phycisphaerae bacterium]